MGNQIASMCIKLYKVLGFDFSFKKQAFLSKPSVHVTLKRLVKSDF